MIDNPRLFTAGPDPFGRKWNVVFRWQQNGISIRHSDSIDVKFELTADDGTTMDKVIAIMHTHALAFCKKHGRQLTDAWCMFVAANHIVHIIETWEDSEKTLVTMSMEQIEEQAAKLPTATAVR